MKIQVRALSGSKQPLTNTSLQLQVKGSQSGSLSVRTDNSGSFQLDDKYQGQQIGTTSLSGNGQPAWITAFDGATLSVNTGTASTAGSGTAGSAGKQTAGSAGSTTGQGRGATSGGNRATTTTTSGSKTH